MLNKNKKIDSKIRFQHRSFRKQLNQARSYRRERKAVSSIEFDNVAGLYRSIPHWVKLACGAAVALLIYFVYVPNPFFVKKIEIDGLNAKQTEQARFLLSKYFSENTAQNNILLASKNRLSAYLLEQDTDVLRVDSIKKRPFSKLIISLTPRVNTFIVTAPEGLFYLDNDFRSFTLATTTAATTSLPQITIESADVIHPGTIYPNTEQLEAIKYLAEKVPPMSDSQITSFLIQSDKESDITLTAQNGTKYLFDYKVNLDDTLEKLNLLLHSIAPGDASRLAYVDMRIKNRGYVCLKGTVCAKLAELPNDTIASTTSSTVDTIIK